jgi:D-3-phosphoglycerate dehydrogenase
MKKVFISTYPYSRTSNEPIAALESAGFDFLVNPFQRKMTASEINQHATGCHAVIAGTEDLSELINNSTDLRIISRVGIGLDSVPLDLCREKKIAVAYTPDAVTDAVVELALGLLITGSRRVLNGDRDIRAGGWTRFYGKRIGNSVVGIIGVGRVGKKVVKAILPLAPAKILLNDTNPEVCSNLLQELKDTSIEIKVVTKEEIFQQSDFISLHLPLSEESRNLICASSLKSLKKDVVIVNTARGGIVNESDLFHFLYKNQDAYACIDVFENEPYTGELTKLENIVLTQHMASCSFDCRERMELEATRNVVSFLLNGKVLADALKDNL